MNRLNTDKIMDSPVFSNQLIGDIKERERIADASQFVHNRARIYKKEIGHPTLCCVNESALAERQKADSEPQKRKYPTHWPTTDVNDDVIDDTLLDEEKCFAPPYPGHLTASPGLVDALEKEFQFKSESDFNTVMALFLAVDRSRPAQGVITPWQTVAAWLGLAHDVHRNKLRDEKATSTHLKRIIREYLPGATWKKSDHARGRAQEVHGLVFAFGDELLDLRDREFETPRFRLAERVYITKNKTPYNSRNQHRRRKNESKDPRVDFSDSPELQGQLGEYMNSRSPNGFLIDETCVLKAYDTVSGWSDPKKAHAHRALAQIEDDSKPLYAPSSGGKTVRLFTLKQSLATIKRELRRILLPDWFELDLVSAQLAIISVDWNLSEVCGFLKTGRKVWNEFYDHVGFSDYGIDYHEAKSAIKKGVYSIAYGAAEANVPKIMKSELSAAGLLPGGLFERFLSHDIVLEMLAARRKLMQEIRADGRRYDEAFGRWITHRHCDNPASILATIAQSREMKLLEPAIDLAIQESERVEEAKKSGKKESSRHDIMLWQHDGFTLRVRDRNRARAIAEQYIQAVNEAVGVYPTKLEVSYSPISCRDIATPEVDLTKSGLIKDVNTRVN